MGRLPVVKIYQNPEQLCFALVKDLQETAQHLLQRQEVLAWAISPTEIPSQFFELLSRPPGPSNFSWSRIHLFQSDQPLQGETPHENNPLLPKELNQLPLPRHNYHFVPPAADAFTLANLHAGILSEFFQLAPDEVPGFDIWVGSIRPRGGIMGIFPGQITMEIHHAITAVGHEPEKGTPWPTFTLPVLNAARNVFVVITGEEKAPVVRRVLHRESGFHTLPIARVNPTRGNYFWYLDQAAASQL